MAKETNGRTRLIIFIIVSVVGLAGVGFGILEVWFVLPVEVAAHAETSAKSWETNKEEHKEMQNDISMNEAECEEIVGIKKDVQYLGEKIDRNWEAQKMYQAEQNRRTGVIIDEIRALRK